MPKSVFWRKSSALDKRLNPFLKVDQFCLWRLAVQLHLLFLQRDEVNFARDEFLTLLYVNRVRSFECEILTVQLHVDHVVCPCVLECYQKRPFVYRVKNRGRVLTLSNPVGLLVEDLAPNTGLDSFSEAHEL